MQLIGFDTETHLIAAPHNLIPRLVCASFNVVNEDIAEEGESRVISTTDSYFFGCIKSMFEQVYSRTSRCIIQNASFDIPVILRYLWEIGTGERRGNPHQAKEVYLLIWEIMERSLDDEWNLQRTPVQQRSTESPVLISDTIIREKLKNLSAHGGIDVLDWGKPQYSLAALVNQYFKVNIFDKKVSIDGNGRYLDSDGNDITGTEAAGAAWRLNYNRLDGVPINKWPQEAYDYALSDAIWARKIWQAQEKKRRLEGPYSMNSEALQVYADVCLQLTTANGFYIDEYQRDKIEDEIKKQLEIINPVLQDQGILRSNGTINKKVVEEWTKDIWENELDRAPIYTEKGRETGRVATGKEVMEILADYSPPLQAYADRQKLAKIKDSFLPALQEGRVWTTFDVLKETGRTSSRQSKQKKGRKPLFPSVNSQQIPRKPGIREMFKGAPGFVICSVDYGALELCSVAQVTYWLFGDSVHKDKINSGYDLHSFLGSRIAMMTDPGVVGGEVHDHESAYSVFIQKREADDEAVGNYRNLAKPTGLGYPGGLGIKTMPVYAKVTYGVVITQEQSKQLKNIWLETYPEMRKYFSWVNNQTDDNKNSTPQASRYAYTTLGLNRHRSNATYCATCNGKAMQSLSADGAKRSLAWVGRACAAGLPDDNPYRILDECFPLTFIHDENLVALPDDDLMTERAVAIQRLMVMSMGIHMPDIRISTEAALMDRWSKKAKTVWVEDHQALARAQQMSMDKYGEDLTVTFQAPDRPRGYRLIPYDRG